MSSRPLALIGMMGAGKSTVGPIIASRSGCPFLDLDQMIVERWQEAIAETFERYGEEEFRRREAEVLEEVAMTGRRLVLATGGGAPLRPENRKRLQQNFWVAWLDAPAEVLYSRAQDPVRPLAADGWDGFRERSQERRSIYAELADLTVDVSEAAPDFAAWQIRAWWLTQEG